MNQTTSLVKIINTTCLPGEIRKIKVNLQRNQEISAIAEGVLRLAIHAVEKMEQGKLKEFDALAGDTACQKRAIVIQELYNASLSQNHLHLKELKLGLENALQNMDKSLNLDQNYKPEDLLKQLIKTELMLSDAEQMMILAHALTLTRDKIKPSETNAENLALFIHSTMLEKVVFKLKESITQLSVKKIRNIAGELFSNPYQEILKKLLGNQNTLNHGEMSYTPCTFNLLAIMERMRQNNGLAVLKIHHIPTNKTKKIILQAHPTNGFQVVNGNNVKTLGAVIFEGISTDENRPLDQIERDLLGDSDIIDRLPKSRFIEVILANAAKHPQYAGKKNQEAIPYFKKEISDVVDSTELSKRRLLNESHAELLKLSEASDEAMLECARAKLYQIAPTHKMQGYLKSLFAVNKDQDVIEILIMHHLYEQLKNRAEAEGLCQENSKSFQLRHIYANTIDDELSAVELSTKEI